jgi:hypothetical protein
MESDCRRLRKWVGGYYRCEKLLTRQEDEGKAFKERKENEPVTNCNRFEISCLKMMRLG